MTMSLPRLNEIQTNREVINGFGGYNHNPFIASSEFYDMQNMSSDNYPLLSPRKQRRRLRYIHSLDGLLAYRKLCWVEEGKLYYGGHLQGEVENGRDKQLVGMGAYILIWPDKMLFNTETYELESLEHSVHIGTDDGGVILYPCRLDGTTYTVNNVAATPPENPTDGEYWVDTSNDAQVLKQYSTAYGMWQGIATTYVMIYAEGIGVGFSEYDAVTVSGLSNDALNGSFVLFGVSDNYVIITGLVAEEYTDFGVTIKREVPDMDFITESNNRIWGCSSKNHEIYACALGDPKNWNRYLGISTDSYAATIGTPGDFTGCISHLGYVLFFKEDELIKIYGNKPANFQLTSTNCRGVQKGSEKSLVIVNETLYYKARDGVCAYNGSLPASVSDALGKVEYRGATAAGLDSKLYTTLFYGPGASPTLFVYDTIRGLWHKEDNVHASDLAVLDTDLYFYDGLYLWSVKGGGDEYVDEYAGPEGTFPWFAQTGDIGLDSLDNKYISKIQLRMEVDARALVRVQLQYDNEDEWEEKFRVNPTKKRAFTIPIIPRRCNTMRLRISGRGDARIHSIAKTIEQGSEL